MEKYPFIAKPLKYNYDALEPYIDEKTMRLHHLGHYRSYVNNLNKALKNHPEYHNYSLVDILSEITTLPREIRNEVRNNGGGVFNHDLYFSIMNPNPISRPIGNLEKKIKEKYTSYETFKIEFMKAALNRFGSGWVWLGNDEAGDLVILSTPNQDTPLQANINPILPLDVWEHAYYLKYNNRREDYVNQWFHTVDWKQVEQRYNNSIIESQEP